MVDVQTKHGEIKTPALIPVVAASYGIWDKWIAGEYPAPWELSQGVILSLYHILKYSYKERIIEEGIHAVLRSHRPVYLDSGGFQYMKKGIELDCLEVLTYEEKMRCDIGITFDYPILPNMEEKEKKRRLEKSILSANLMLKEKKTDMQLYGAIHGSNPAEIIRYMGKLDEGFSGYGIGSLVPRKNQLNHLIEMIFCARQQTEKPLHCFGITGFPALFALSYLGVDTFDSWAYVVAAAFKEFVHPVTLSRVKGIKQEGLPECDCSVCTEFTQKDMIGSDSTSEIILALHNLNIFLKEMEGIREASRENNLGDYMRKRAQKANKKVKTAFEMAEKRKHQQRL